MPASAASTNSSRRLHDALPLARQIIEAEARTLHSLAELLSEQFNKAVSLLLGAKGAVVVSGMGKAGHVGQKIAATLCSTGTRSYFLHPAEAIHGDLGRIHQEDIALVLSTSGETEEIVRLIPSLQSLGAALIAVTCKPESTLGRGATITLDLGPIQEACPLGLAPSATTAAMMALGDALALVVSQARGFSAEDFVRFHPGGSLGRKLAKVEEVMRPLADCRVAQESQTLRSALVNQSRPGRRTGAIMVVNAAGKLTGIFTDSDLARLLESRRDSSIDQPVSQVMTQNPKSVALGTLLPTACEILAEKKISELPVVDRAGRPLGLVDITDIVATSGPGSSRTSAAGGPPVLKLVPSPRRKPKK
ncbi:MAG: SIS domain-containing protein [Pirellulaceae bacterium]